MYVSRSCPNSQMKPCSHCDKFANNNRHLCPEKCASQPSNSLVTGPSNSASDPSASDSPPTDDNTNATNITQSLLASGEKILLQTATVSLQTLDSRVTVQARVLLDNASQCSFMTSQLAQKLGLASERKEVLSVSTFGAHKATDIDTCVVCFKIKLKDGSFMMLYANVLKQITGSIQRNPLIQKNLEFLQAIPTDRKANRVPSTLENTTIDLSIGLDYFWNIVEGDKVILSSGMFLVPSKFVTGKF